MKDLLHRLGLGAGRKKWQFQEGALEEDTEEFPNPARGWYQIHTFRACEEPDFHELEWCLNRSDTLAMVLIDIGEFRDRDLDGETLGRIGRILEFFGENHYDVILRVVYDHEGRAMEREPFFFAQVLSHLQQIGGILKRYASCVFLFQGMLVGNWGEMHTSRFLSEEKLAQMADVLRMYREGQTYLAVRRPVYWRMLHPGQEGSVRSCPDGMGLYDDGMFGSESHLGTFGEGLRSEAPWDAPWVREDELAFEGELCRYVPNGGEAVFGDDFWKELTPERVLEDLRRMQVTYLNRIHDPRALEIWRKCRCPEQCRGARRSGQGAWADKSMFDYVGAHLGYRFLIRRTAVTQKKGEPGLCHVEIEVENTGFASFYQEGEVLLECVPSQGQSVRAVPACQLKGWCSGEKRVLACDVELCDCELFLSARRKRDGAVIRFANCADDAGRAVIGRIRVRQED